MKVTITERLRSLFPRESQELEREVMARKFGQPKLDQRITVGNKTFTMVNRGTIKPR